MKGVLLIVIGVIAGVILGGIGAMVMFVPKPDAEGRYHLSEPIVKDVPPIEHFLHAETLATLATMERAVDEYFMPLSETLTAAGVIGSPPIFAYYDMNADAEGEFRLRMGFPMRPGVAAPNGVTDATLPAYHCVSAYYTGAMEHVTKVYEQLFAQIIAGGYQPTGNIREIYLQWEEAASPHNVTEIQIEIE